MAENPTQSKYTREYFGLLNWERQVVGLVSGTARSRDSISSALCLSVVVSVPVSVCLSLSIAYHYSVLFLGSLYGNRFPVAASILTAWDQSAKVTSMSIPQKGLGWILLGLFYEKKDFSYWSLWVISTPSVASELELFDGLYKGKNHIESQRLFPEIKPLFTATKVTPPGKRPDGICNIDGKGLARRWLLDSQGDSELQDFSAFSKFGLVIFKYFHVPVKIFGLEISPWSKRERIHNLRNRNLMKTKDVFRGREGRARKQTLFLFPLIARGKLTLRSRAGWSHLNLDVTLLGESETLGLWKPVFRSEDLGPEQAVSVGRQEAVGWGPVLVAEHFILPRGMSWRSCWHRNQGNREPRNLSNYTVLSVV